MATTTTTTTANTKYTYNNDFSAANAYAPKERTAQYLTANLNSIGQQAAKEGLDYTYSQAALNNLFKQSADAQLAQSLYGVDRARTEFGRSLNQANRSVVDALRSETAGAIASGTSRAIADSNVLKAILGLQQESVADATALAQERQQAYVDYGAALAQGMLDANERAQAYQSDIANRALQLFATQQQSYDSKYTADQTYNANAYAADAAAYQALLAALASRVMSQNTTSTQSTYTPDQSVTSGVTPGVTPGVSYPYTAKIPAILAENADPINALLAELDARASKTNVQYGITQVPQGPYPFQDGMYNQVPSDIVASNRNKNK